MASWRKSVHDDLVVATALACRWREWYVRHWNEVVTRSHGYRHADAPSGAPGLTARPRAYGAVILRFPTFATYR